MKKGETDRLSVSSEWSAFSFKIAQGKRHSSTIYRQEAIVIHTDFQNYTYKILYPAAFININVKEKYALCVSFFMWIQILRLI